MIDLRPYVSIDSDNNCLSKPFSVVSNKIVWNGVTNLYWLVLVKDPEEVYPPWPGGTENTNVLFKLLRSEPIKSRTVEVARLVDWTVKKGLGRLFTVVISLDKLATLLQLVKSKEIQVWDATKVVGDYCLGFEAEKLRIFLMGHDKSKLKKGVPIALFEMSPVMVSSVEQSGFDLAMSLDEF